MESSRCAESEPFALRVLGDSMSPEFGDGCVVIIDPSMTAKSGYYVLANEADEYIFRQVFISDTEFVLKAINSGYEDIHISGHAEIHGVIIQQSGKRRKDSKKYDY